MLTKWILTAALFCGITVSASAVPAEPLGTPVRVELRGKLAAFFPPISPDDDPIIHLCFPPLRMYTIEVNGQSFHLNLGRFASQADKLNGRLVIVTGTLDLDTVTVTGLEQPKDEALTQYVKVTIVGQLQREEIGTCDPQGGSFVQWHIQVGKVNYTLNFADPKVEAAAKKLVGTKVVITGSLKNGTVQAHDVSPTLDLNDLMVPVVR